MGESFARGVSVVAFYPTHGYLGLAYNLGTPCILDPRSGFLDCDR